MNDGQGGADRRSGRPDDGGQDGKRENGGRGDQQTSTAETVVTVVSVVFTVLLFAYGGWQMVAPPQDGAPQATVTDTSSLSNGSVAVTVELKNPKDVGLISVTVESDCTSPPPQVEFSFVPADTSRTGTLVCPPETVNPSVSVSSWVSR